MDEPFVLRALLRNRMSWKKAESLMYLGMNMHMIREVEAMVPATRVVRAPGLADLADEDDAQLSDDERKCSRRQPARGLRPMEGR